MSDNEKIAEFMEVQVYRTWEEMDSVPIENLKTWAYNHQLQYDTDWSRLMPVIEKIAKIPCIDDTDEERDTYYPRTFGMMKDDRFMFRINMHQLYTGQTLIEAAYAGVIDFIEWYNQQKP